MRRAAICPRRFPPRPAGRAADSAITSSRLRHLVAEWDRRRPAEETLPPESRLLLRTPSPERDDDAAFKEAWRKDLLNRAWAGLEKESAERGQLLCSALRLKADDPARTSATLATLLAEQHGRPMTAEAVRQILHRARERFAAHYRPKSRKRSQETTPARSMRNLRNWACWCIAGFDPGHEPLLALRAHQRQRSPRWRTSSNSKSGLTSGSARNSARYFRRSSGDSESAPLFS